MIASGVLRPSDRVPDRQLYHVSLDAPYLCGDFPRASRRRRRLGAGFDRRTVPAAVEAAGGRPLSLIARQPRFVSAVIWGVVLSFVFRRDRAGDMKGADFEDAVQFT